LNYKEKPLVNGYSNIRETSLHSYTNPDEDAEESPSLPSPRGRGSAQPPIPCLRLFPPLLLTLLLGVENGDGEDEKSGKKTNFFIVP